MITFALPLALLSFKLPLELTLTEPLFEKEGDRVRHTLELFVALLFSGLEAPRYVSADKRHGDGIRSGAMATTRADRRGNYRWKCGLWGENERAWGLATERERLGHERLGVAHPEARGKKKRRTEWRIRRSRR